MSNKNHVKLEKVDAIKNYMKNFDYQNVNESINGFTKFLKQINIKMIAFDFDYTIIGAHSSGYIDKLNDVDNIGTAVTTDFKIFSKYLFSNGIQMTVATFSDEEFIRNNKSNSNLLAGEKLVYHCLKKSYCNAKIEKVYGYYPYFYRESKKYRALGLDKPMSNDKSFHLEKIRQEFFVNYDEILFIDDDINSCISAKNEGYIVFNVTGKDGFNFKNIKIL